LQRNNTPEIRQNRKAGQMRSEIEGLKLNEQIARQHVLQLRATVIPTAAKVFQARLAGNAEAEKKAADELGTLKNEIAEQEKFYGWHADELLQALEADLKLIASLELTSVYTGNAAALETAILEAKVNRRQILKD
jgi:hypothetical protein